MRSVNASVLFVDDDPNLRQLVPAVLASGGYEVNAAGTVSDALGLLKSRRFDVILSDLNIGEPGDGFTVVSAARRIHPETLTLIITGFPDFQGALDAIRKQADDYLIKPVQVPHLLHTIGERLKNRTQRQPAANKRVSEILHEHKDFLLSQWMTTVNSQPDFAAIPLSDCERIDQVPEIVNEVIVALESDRPDMTSLEDLSSTAREAALRHGKTRRRQRYTIRMLLREARIMQREMYRLEQAHLLEMDISHLIPDMIRATDTLEALFTESISAYVTA